MPEHLSPHWYYAESARQFVQDGKKKRYFREMLEKARQAHGDFGGTEKELNSWEYSTPALSSLIESVGLSGDQIIILEYRLDTMQRVDALLCGKDKEGCDNVFMLELKQWYGEGRFDLEPSPNEGKIRTVMDGRQEEICHPSIQVDQYFQRLAFLEKKRFGTDDMLFYACGVYMHRIREWRKKWKDILFAPKFKEAQEENPLYMRKDPNLIRAIKRNIGFGSGVSGLQKLTAVSPMK